MRRSAPRTVRARKPEASLLAADDASHVYVTPSEAELAQRRSYQCACCSRFVSNPQALKKHLRSHGDEGAAALAALEAGDATGLAGEAEGGAGADERPRYYYCPAPGCEHNYGVTAEAHPFKTLRNLRDHYQLAHNAAVAECACAKCGKTFKVKGRMQSHQKHCGEQHRCSCGATFRDRRNLANHLKLPTAAAANCRELPRSNTAAERLVHGGAGAGDDGADGLGGLGDDDGGV